MSYVSVSCIATSPAQAEHILVRLKAAKFANHDISVLLADPGFAHWSHRLASVAGDGTAGSWIAGIGGLPIPEVGPFMAAGPILAASFNAGNGAAACGIAGGLAGLGIPESQTLRFEGRIRDGHILISVHTGNSRQIAQATSIFACAGAQDTCCSGAAAAAPASKHGERALKPDPEPVGYGIQQPAVSHA